MTDKTQRQDLLKPAKKLLEGAPDMSISAEERAKMTLACQDSDYIPKIKNAGKSMVVNGTTVQVMHNGIYVKKGAYQGEWQAKVIEGLKGNHEPQEEKVFYEVLKKISPGGIILELGSWWSYYSMWFLKSIKEAKAICCEPDPDNLGIGKTNMKLNNFSSPTDVTFYQSAAGFTDGKIISFTTEKKQKKDVPVRTVDSILDEQKIEKLDVLHMDIQGAELAALKGAKRSIQKGKIRFVFVSTHHYVISNDPLVHQKCLDFIINSGGYIISEHTVAESCSGDGLIVASFKPEDKNFKVEQSLHNTNGPLFRSPEKDVALLWGAHDKLLRYIAQLGAELEGERQKNLGERQKNMKEKEEQNRKLKWVYSHPIRFTAADLYHRYILRDRRRGEFK